MYILGVNPLITYQPTTTDPSMPVPDAVGTRGLDNQGNEYVFLQAAAITTNGAACFYVPGTFSATLLSTANDDVNQVIAFAKTAFAANEFGWFQRYGQLPIQTSGNTAIALPVLATATPGVLTTNATVAALFPIRGITLLQAGQTLPLLTNAYIQYPMATSVVAVA